MIKGKEKDEKKLKWEEEKKRKIEIRVPKGQGGLTRKRCVCDRYYQSVPQAESKAAVC